MVINRLIASFMYNTSRNTNIGIAKTCNIFFNKINKPCFFLQQTQQL